MSYLNDNIKHLRKQCGYTQDTLAQRIGVKRSNIGAYEEHRAEPKIATIQKLAYLFEVDLEQLINYDLSKGLEKVDTEGKTLRVLPIAIDTEGRERITVVPITAEAGYAHSYGDPEYIGELPHFSLPLQELYHDQTMRLFQISGESMLPVPSGSYIISSYLENWDNVKEGSCYIVVTRDNGIVYKRIFKGEGNQLLLVSDNALFPSYEVAIEDVVEIWSAGGFITFELPDNQDSNTGITQIGSALSQMQEDLTSIKNNLSIS